MNRPNLPGFYFDEEKGKYFKIQPNHDAPTGSKYSALNVDREKRQLKKLKLDQSQQQKKRQETVHRPWTSHHPLLIGVGLQREHGQLEQRAIPRDQALIKSFKNTDKIIRPPTPTATEYRVIDLIAAPHDAVEVLNIRYNPESHALYRYYNSANQEPQNRNTAPLFAYNAPIISLSSHKNADTSWLVVCTSEANFATGNLFIHSLDSEVELTATHAYGIGKRGEFVWAAAQHRSEKLALSGSRTVSINDFTPTGLVAHSVSRNLDVGEESFALAWLNPQTLAFATRKEFDRRTRRLRIASPPKGSTRTPDSGLDQEVRLWDIRSNGLFSRLNCASRITGVMAPDFDATPDLMPENHGGTTGGHTLLLANARELSLYDLRFAQVEDPVPVLTFEHHTSAAQMDWAMWKKAGGGGILAACDAQGFVYVYSLATGTRINGTGFKSVQGKMSAVRWREDASGVPYLQTCTKNAVQRWSWMGKV